MCAAARAVPAADAADNALLTPEQVDTASPRSGSGRPASRRPAATACGCGSSTTRSSTSHQMVATKIVGFGDSPDVADFSVLQQTPSAVYFKYRDEHQPPPLQLLPVVRGARASTNATLEMSVAGRARSTCPGSKALFNRFADNVTGQRAAATRPRSRSTSTERLSPSDAVRLHRRRAPSRRSPGRRCAPAPTAAWSRSPASACSMMTAARAARRDRRSPTGRRWCSRSALPTLSARRVLGQRRRELALRQQPDEHALPRTPRPVRPVADRQRRLAERGCRAGPSPSSETSRAQSLGTVTDSTPRGPS